MQIMCEHLQSSDFVFSKFMEVNFNLAKLLSTFSEYFDIDNIIILFVWGMQAFSSGEVCKKIDKIIQFRAYNFLHFYKIYGNCSELSLGEKIIWKKKSLIKCL